MTSKERLHLILVIGIIVLGGLTINHTFTLLTPLPDSPEMDRAKAEAMLMQTEARLQDHHLYRTFLVGTGVVLAGIAVCFSSLLLALQLIKAASGLNKASERVLLALPPHYEEKKTS